MRASRVCHRVTSATGAMGEMLPGLSREYASAVLDALDDRCRGDADQHLLECLKVLVLTDRLGVPVETSRELGTVRAALAARPVEYAGLREAISGCEGGCGCGCEGGCGFGCGCEHRGAPVAAGSASIRCVAAYVQAFGPFTPRTVLLWPDAQAVKAELGVGVSGLNDAAAGWCEGRTLSPLSPLSPWRRLGAVSRVSELAASPMTTTTPTPTP
ncbi:hypothetical protein HWD99_09430 [Microbacterium sp. C5A9]|uniref:hypothetical protein n=1 Tax=Microbacterium sp. C5A9 TaxID=2736663 RepID=UPI001F517A18|nr:hypothetical protein [Microbacterium sp. C5A9]MCI1018845.1 hypothetical protein [Microbacterium sp. C5A9]